MAHPEMKDPTFYKYLLENIDEGIMVMDKDDRIFFVNESMAKIAGVAKEQIIGLVVLRDFSQGTLKEYRSYYLKAKESLTTVSYDFIKVITPAGRITYQSGILVPLMKDGHYDGMICTVFDNTRLKHAEEELREAGTWYHALFEDSNDAIIIVKDQRFIECNQMALEMFGFKNKEDILHCSPLELSPRYQPDGRESQEKALEIFNAALQGAPQRFYWKHIRKDGTPFDAEVSINRIDLGDRLFIKALVTDITERMRAEEALLLMQFAIDRAPENILLVGEQGDLEYVNNAACTSMGYSREELLSMKVFDIDPDFPVERWEQHKINLRHLDKMTFEGRHRRKDGELFPVEVTTNYLEYKGRFLGVAFDRDISDRKRVEEQSALNAQYMNALLRLNQMTEATDQEVMDFALEEAVQLTRSTIGYLAFLNDDESVLTMQSWSKSAMKECAIADKPIMYPVATTGLWGEAVRQRRPVITNDYALLSPYKKGYPAGHVAVRRHMNIPVFEGLRIVLVAGVGNKAEEYDQDDIRRLTLLMEGMWRLIERNRSEGALRESEAQYRLLAENIHDSIITLDLDLRFTYVSPSIMLLTGYSVEEIQALSVEQLFTPRSHALIKQVLTEELARNSRGEAESIERRIPRTLELELLRKDGNIIWIELTTTFIVDNQGNAMKILVVARDITQRKQTELEREKLLVKHQHALAEIKTLSGMLPICSNCKKIRDDKGYWNQLETYISEHTDTIFSHGLCPECAKKLYPDYFDRKK